MVGAGVDPTVALNAMFGGKQSMSIVRIAVLVVRP